MQHEEVARRIQSGEWHVWDLMKDVECGGGDDDWQLMEGAWFNMVLGRQRGRSKIEAVVMILTEAVRELEEEAQH